MTHESRSQFESYLTEGGVTLSDEAYQKFDTLKDLLYTHNSRHNLTSIDAADYELLHIADSLIPLFTDDIQSNSRVFDIGCGAGFPGIPLAIARRDITVDFLDATQKKIDFVSRALHELDLAHCNAYHGRAEDFGQDARFREAYDICTSRALAELAVLLEYMLPFVKPGGMCLALKGKEDLDEDALQNLVEEFSGELLAPYRIRLPGGRREERTIIRIRKRGPLKECYPRSEKKIRKGPPL